jgi:hypothetical protein
VCYGKCNESESMMKPRKGKVRCEKRAVTFVPVISVAEIWLPATSHPGLNGTEFMAGCEREQVKSSVSGQMITGSPCVGLAQADGGRLSRSSVERSVIELERRTWLVWVSSRQQLKLISG